MKKINSISLVLFAALLWLIPACTPNEPSEDSLFINENQVKDHIDGRLYNLRQFLDSFMTEEGNFHSDTSQYRTRAQYKDLYLFSIDTLPTNGEGIYIRGRVTTDDYGGNFYKSIVIQQVIDWETGDTLRDADGNVDQQALRLSVDMGSASGLFHQGQEVLIRCNGLAVGRYANQPQLCVPSYNNNIYAGSASQKVGWAPGRIPSPRFRQAAQLIGKADKSKLVYDVLDMATVNTRYLSKFKDVKSAREADGRLVRITGVHFTGTYDNQGTEATCNRWDPENPSQGNPEDDSNAYVFGPTTGNVGYPQSRYVADSTGLKILVSASEYAKYAYYYLPAPKYVGSVTGVLGYYMDNGFYDPDGGEWAVSPNNLGDILPECQAEDADPRWIPTEWTKNNPQPADEDEDEEADESGEGENE